MSEIGGQTAKPEGTIIAGPGPPVIRSLTSDI
jgi:hypothetical protein